ncbi:tRNA (guanosine(37)-N1)-methyltransferase TrmD [Patescibacteria group bacterium]|nr:tRNA (guanosine(37)-N1)-methyltransferase TrmD [Patescibacteria group bacterium]
MHFHIITLFPEAFKSYLAASIIGRAFKDKKIKVNFYNPRDFTKNSYKRVDQKPYGGGPGMVIEAEATIKAVTKAIGKKKNVKIIFFATSGANFTNQRARKYSKNYKHIVLICGHYEGMDARVRKVFKAEEVSIGPYIVTGGELPALVVLDSVTRQIPGVLGNIASLEENRITNSDVYTRPETITYKGKKYKVPSVLLSGHHKNIEDWKKKS